MTVKDTAGTELDLAIRQQKYRWIADLGLILFFFFQAWIFIQPLDDAFISFRYARNLARGDGLVYNVGEYVEGISNLLWTVGLAGLYRAGIAMADAARLLNVFCLGLGILLCRAAMTRMFGSRSAWPLIMTALIVVHTNIPVSCGRLLEGSAVFLLVSLLIYSSVRRSALGLSLCAALFILNRPEGMAIALFIVIWSAYEYYTGRFSIRQTLAIAMTACMVLAAVSLFRFYYYGDLIPNSLRAKMLAGQLAGRRDEMLKGAHYLWSYYGGFWPLLCLIPFALFKKGNRVWAGFLIALIAFNGFTICMNGGDWMGEYRLLTPYFPLIAALAVLGASALPRHGIVYIPVTLLIAYGGYSLLNVKAFELLSRRDFSAMIRWDASNRYPDIHFTHRVTDHLVSADFLYPDDKIVMENGGAPAYLLDSAYCIEMSGLCQKELLSLNPSVYHLLSIGVVNPIALFSMQPSYMVMPMHPHENAFPFAEECYRELGQYLVALREREPSDKQEEPYFVVRDDRVTLPQFIMDFGAIIPAQDFCRSQRFDLPFLSSWHEEPWRNTDGAKVTSGWHRWGDTPRLSWRYQQNPGTVRLSKPLEDGSPLLFLIGLPPQTRPGAQITVSVRAPAQEPQPLDVIAAEDNATDAFVTCASVLKPPPWTPGMEILLEVSSEYAFEPTFTLYRWTAAGTPTAPIEYIWQAQLQKQHRDARIQGLAQVDFSTPTDDTMAMAQRRRALLSRAVRLRQSILRTPAIQTCQALTDLFLKENEIGMLLTEWKTIACSLPLSPPVQYHLALAYAKAGQTEAAFAVLKSLGYANIKRQFSRYDNFTDVLDGIDPPAIVQHIEAQMAQCSHEPLLGVFIANMAVSVLQREEKAAIPSRDSINHLLKKSIERHPHVSILYDALMLLNTNPEELDRLTEFWTTAIRQYPEKPWGWYGLGRLNEKKAMLEAALEAYENALQWAPQDRLYKDAVLRLLAARGQELLKAGDADQAGQLFLRVQSLGNDGAQSRVNIGDVFLQQGRIEEARQAYRQAIATSPYSYDAYEKLSNTFVQSDDLDGLLNEWQTAVETMPESALAWFSLGLAQERRDALDKAQEAYEKALALAPDAGGTKDALARVLTARGYASLKAGAIAEAEAAFQRASDLSPNNIQAMVGLADVYATQGNIEQARTTYRKAIAALPSAYDAYDKLSNTFVQQGDLDGLLLEWQKAVEATPESALAWFSLGVAQERRDVLDKAQEAYEKALALAPDTAGTKDALARVLTARGNASLKAGALAEAEAAFQRASTLSPAQSDVIAGLGDLRASQGDIEQARTAYRKAIAALPSAYEAYDKLSNTFVQQGDLDGLLNEWQKAVEASPESALAWFSLGLAQERRNALEQAQDAYEKALTLAPDAAGTKEALARVRAERDRLRAKQ